VTTSTASTKSTTGPPRVMAASPRAAAVTDAENLARVAALRSRRGQPAADRCAPQYGIADGQREIWAPPTSSASAGPVRPSPTRRTARPLPRKRHVAGGARIAVAGLAVSGMFGLTAVLAAANQPPTPSKTGSDAPAVNLIAQAPATTATTGPAAPPTIAALVLPPPAPVAETIVLAIPDLPITVPPSDGPVTPTAPVPAIVQRVGATPKPARTTAPAPAAAAPPVTTQPHSQAVTPAVPAAPASPAPAPVVARAPAPPAPAATTAPSGV
jgi:hypothetical protein